MLWRIFQMAVFVGAGGWLAANRVTDNGVVHALGAMAAAFVATWIVSKIIDWSRLLRRKLVPRHHGRERTEDQRLRQIRPRDGGRPGGA